MRKMLIFLILAMLLCTPVLAQEAAEYSPQELLQIWHQVIALMREAECYPYVELSQGDRGYEVMFLQARLAQLNYYGKKIDPQFGSGTHAAVRMFERVHDLQVNGVASVEDQRLLFSSKAKINTGNPAGVDAGETMPPVEGTWPEWWHPMPELPIITQPPGPAVTGIKIPDLNLPTAIPILTPTPKPTQPVIEIPGFDLATDIPVLTPKPIDPGQLNTEMPNLIPDFVFPGT